MIANILKGILILLAGTGMYLGARPIPLPVDLQLKTDKINIVSEEILQEKGIDIIKYSYKNGKILDRQNELKERRTPHSRTYKISQDSEKITYETEIFAGEPQFYQEGNEWYQLDYATTTLDAYTKQTVSFLGRITDKVWATTSTVYPSSDGAISPAADATWSNVHDALTGTLTTTESEYVFARYFTGAGDYDISRYLMTFDTSVVGGDTVDSVTFSIVGFTKGGTVETTYAPVSSTHSDTVVAGDYDLCGTTQYATPIGLSAFSTAGYNNYTGNSSFISAINGAGNTKICLREITKDVGDTAPVTDENNYIGIKTDATADVTSDPKLVIVHSTPVVGGAVETDNFIWFE